MGSGQASGDGAFRADSREYCLYTRTTLQKGDQVLLAQKHMDTSFLVGCQLSVEFAEFPREHHSCRLFYVMGPTPTLACLVRHLQ